MTVQAIVGLQWGDEGKGKIVDKLAEHAHVVARAQGGDNAGHTVVVNDEVFKLHLMPSGAVREGIPVIIGNGVVANPLTLIEEVDELEGRGNKILERLYVSDRAHILLPFHKILDGLREQSRGKGSIGTTKRGIGPCYADKITRCGLRYHHAKDKVKFAEAVVARVEDINKLIELNGGEKVDAASVIAEVEPAMERLRPRIADTVGMLQDALKERKNILLEGAQGAMLDIDFGTYPFLTSSNTTSGGLCTGSGLPPTCINEVHGVLKAFTTRVGAGAFITELDGDLGGLLRGNGANQWDEFGTTTGRPRRCGWLDLVVGKYAVEVNGVTHLHITKLDIMGQFDELKVCTAYRLDGEVINHFPASVEDMERCEPVYETLPGWKCKVDDCQTVADLPPNAKAYVDLISRVTGADIGSVSYGPARSQTIFNLEA